MNRTFKVISSLIIVLIFTFYGFADISLGPSFKQLFKRFPVSLIPGTTNSVDLGSALKKWKNLFVENIVGPLTITGTKTITSDGSINITSYYSPMKTDTVVAGAVTVDWDDGNTHYIVLASGANTITLANPESGANYKIYLKQPSSGAAGTVTFSPVPLWPSGVAPMLTVTNSALDVAYFGYDGTASKYDADVSLDVK
jgi:hypothetical protein